MTIGTLQEPKATTFLGLLGQLTGLRFGNLTLAAIFPDLRRAFRLYCFVFPRNAFIYALCRVNSPKLLVCYRLFS